MRIKLTILLFNDTKITIRRKKPNKKDNIINNNNSNDNIKQQ